MYGYSYNDNTQSVVRFRHDGKRGDILRTEPNGYGSVIANDHLVVETYSGTQPSLLYWKGHWIDLNAQIDNLGDFVIGDGIQMNDNGDFVGTGRIANGETRGFVALRNHAGG